MDEALGVVENPQHGRSIPIRYGGKEYASRAELARAYGINITTFSSRLKEGWTMDEALGVVKRQHRKGIPIRYDGKEYSSKSELARAYGTNIKAFSSRLKKGWTMDEALGVVKHRNGKLIRYDGKEYASRAELARAYGIHIKTFSSRLREGWTMDEALGVVQRQHGRSIPIRYDGKEYASRAELARDYGIKITTFSYRLKEGWTMDEALGVVQRQHRKGIPIRYDGKEYASRAELVRAYGIKIITFYARLKRGWTIDEALGVVQRQTTQQSTEIVEDSPAGQKIVDEDEEFETDLSLQMM